MVPPAKGKNGPPGREPSVPLPNITCELVPAPVTANVPDEVIGEPATEKAAGIVRATLVTVPCGANALILDTVNVLVELGVVDTSVPTNKSPEAGVTVGYELIIAMFF